MYSGKWFQFFVYKEIKVKLHLGIPSNIITLVDTNFISSS